MNAIEYAYHRFATERFPLPTASALTELEARIRVAFPDEYRRFILKFNGGYFSEPEIEPAIESCPADCLVSLHGIGAPHWSAELGYPSTMALFEDNDPPQIVPIGFTTTGSLILLIVTGEETERIVYKEAYGDFYFLADGIEEFFELLRERPT